MAKIPQELSAFVELDDAVARIRSGEPDIFVSVDANRLEPPGPAGNIGLVAPSPENVAIGVKFYDLWPEYAAFGTDGTGRGAKFIRPGIISAIDRPGPEDRARCLTVRTTSDTVAYEDRS